MDSTCAHLSSEIYFCEQFCYCLLSHPTRGAWIEMFICRQIYQKYEILEKNALLRLSQSFYNAYHTGSTVEYHGNGNTHQNKNRCDNDKWQQRKMIGIEPEHVFQ